MLGVVRTNNNNNAGSNRLAYAITVKGTEAN